MFLPFGTNLLCMYVCSVVVEYTTSRSGCQANYEKTLNFTSKRRSSFAALSSARLTFSLWLHIIEVQMRMTVAIHITKWATRNPCGTVNTEGVSCCLGVSACQPWTVRQATCRCSKLLYLLRRTAQMKIWSPFLSPPSPYNGVGRPTLSEYHKFRRFAMNPWEYVKRAAVHTHSGSCSFSIFYFAYSTARLSRMTLTLIWPG